MDCKKYRTVPGLRLRTVGGLPEGITLKVQLHLGKELEIAFFPDEPEHEECKNCPQYDSCAYVNENNCTK